MSLQRVSIPVSFGVLNCYLNVEVIPGNVPLLLSVKSLKKTRAIIDVHKHMMIIPESAPIDLEELASGHFAVEIFPRNSPTDSLQLFTTEVLNEKSLIKLRRQFGHCRPERLGGLLRSAGKLGNWKMNDIEKILNSCQVCEKLGQLSRRPIVSFPHSESSNETISLDLHQISSTPTKWYVHIIDMYTRFSEAEMISNKMSSTTIDVLNRKWTFAHGAPKNILTDNGGEFGMELFRQNVEFFNNKVSSTAANSPFSNGCCERHNMILTQTFQKVKSD